MESTGYADTESIENGTVQDLLDSEEAELLSWLQEGVDEFNRNPIREINSEDKTINGSGEISQTNTTEIVDADRQIIKSIMDYGYGEPSVDYYSKEGDTEYYYTERYGAPWDDENREADYYIQKTILDDTAPDYYRYSYESKGENLPIQPTDALTAESSRIEDIRITGTEDEGDLIKIELVIESRSLETREQFYERYLEEIDEGVWGFSQEDLALKEDGTEIVDEYITQAWLEREEVSLWEQTYWITQEDHCLVRKKWEGSYAPTEEAFEAEQNFYDLSEYIDEYKDQLQAGAAEEEARKAAEARVEEMEKYKASYAEAGWEAEWVYTYLTGNECTPIGELPAEDIVVTYEEYMEDINS